MKRVGPEGKQRSVLLRYSFSELAAVMPLQVCECAMSDSVRGMLGSFER